jgi:hypothetical protein
MASNDLKTKVRQLVEANVPEEEIAQFIQQFSEPSKPHSFTGDLKEAAANIPASAGTYAKGLAQFVGNPKEGADMLGQVAAGGMQKALAIDGDPQARQTYEQFTDHYKNRYGSLENIYSTMKGDPVGMMGDASGALMGTGLLMRGAGALPKAAPLATAGKVVQDIGASAEPLSVAMQGAGKAVGLAVPKKVTRKMYESSAKFSTVLTNEQRARLTEVALKNEIPPTIGGVKRVNDLISEIGHKISNMVEEQSLQFALSPTAQGPRGLPVMELFKDFDKLRTQLLETSANPIGNIEKIGKIERQILEANQRLGRSELSPRQAQKLKQGIYKELEGLYGQFNNSPADVKAKKAIAKTAKEYLEEVMPEIKQLNANEGELIKLREAIQRSANRISNRDLMGLGAPVKAGAGGVVGGPEGAVAGYILGILDTPAIKSRLAIAADRLRSKGVKISPTSAAVRLGLVTFGKHQFAEDNGYKPVPTRKVGKLADTDYGFAQEVD